MTQIANPTINQYVSLSELCHATCKRFGELPAFSQPGVTLSFSELDYLSKQWAAFLQHHTKLSSGDRIAIQLPNLTQYAAIFYGALYAGLVVVNTNPLYTSRELIHQFKDSGTIAWVVFDTLLPQVNEVLAATDIQWVIACSATDLLPNSQHDIELNLNLPSNQAITFRQAITIGNELLTTTNGVASNNTSHAEDLALLQYTGGTTGLSKGAMLQHKHLLNNAEQTKERFATFLKPGQEICVAPLPLYHAYGCCVNMILLFALGVHNILIPNPRNLDAFVKQISNQRISLFCGINTLFIGLCNHPEFKALDFSHLKLTISGGTTLTPAVAELWEQVTGCQISEGYGLSETSPVVSFNDPRNPQIGTVGKPLQDTQCILVDIEGNEVTGDEPGELWVKGPQVMQGYWQQPEATAEMITADGWLKTGDIATQSTDGLLRIVDRKKDMIIVSGFNVYPAEIESVVNAHPEVLESAVIGVTDEKTGEAVKLFVIPKDPEQFNIEHLIQYCRQNLTAYKVPKHIITVTELPKTNVGKIIRRILKEETTSSQ